jgi:uncharacterized protein
MKVDLRRLSEELDARGVVTAEESIKITDSFGNERTADFLSNLSWERRGGAFFFHGELSGKLHTSCHLCLEDAMAPLKGEFVVVLRRGVDREAGREAGRDETVEETPDMVTLAANEHEFSFDPYIAENLTINIPMQIVCREGCKGLCPQCGINRNEAPCECADTTDSRWDTLRKLKNE